MKNANLLTDQQVAAATGTNTYRRPLSQYNQMNRGRKMKGHCLPALTESANYVAHCFLTNLFLVFLNTIK